MHDANPKNVFVAGHRGMVGSAICRELKKNNDINLIIANRAELDLTKQTKVQDFFSQKKIDEVYLAAAKVGGIHANNTFPAEFIYENLMIQTNIIHAAFESGITKLLFLGSSCIYPKFATQPIEETELLSGYLEPTNEPYALAKISGIKMCESYNRQYGTSFRSVMPTNLYGPGDNFHPENSHVIPALIQRFHDFKINKIPEINIWGSGEPYREFLHVDDMAKASLHIMDISNAEYFNLIGSNCSHINVGTGEDISIKKLAEMIRDIVGYQGAIFFDRSKPDGPPKKLLNVGRLNSLGWSHSYDLKEGIKNTYEWYLKNINRIRSS